MAQDILDKIERGMPGYEGNSGRYAAYYMGYINQHRFKDLPEARKYYQQAILFAKQTDTQESGYSLNSYANIARMADQQGDTETARNYFGQLKKLTDRKSPLHQEAQKYLKKTK